MQTSVRNGSIELQNGCSRIESENSSFGKEWCWLWAERYECVNFFERDTLDKVDNSGYLYDITFTIKNWS